MSNFICSVDSCPVILSSICVIYQGENLIYTGISDGDNLQAALQKIDAAFADAGLGYAFQNGVIQTTPGVPVELGGSLLRDTTIAGNYKLTLAGRIEAARHITTGGTASQFVKGDGTLDSTAYQVAGNYITALTGDGTAVGPGSAALTLATVNANPGTYGTSTLIPRITVDAKGRVTSITTTAIPNVSNILVFEGDVTGSGTTGAPVTLTLATVNPNVYNSLTFLNLKVNAKGLVTGASPVTNLDIEGALGYVPVPNTRTITINGVTQNLQANRSWTIPGGGTVTSVSVTAGTGIAASVTNPSTTPNITITNTAPDQVVSITPGTGITVTGTYPNFTVAATNAGTVTSVTASAPLASSGGATPNITITQAGASANGYLSSTDWNTFNNKVPTSRTLTINGVSFNLAADRTWTINSMVYPSAGIAVSTGSAWGTSLVDNSTNWNTAYTERISSATAPLSITSNTISISQASASTNGYLSSTDWTTFNSKQASGSYITALTGEATATGPGSATVTLSTPAVTGKVLTGVNITGGTVLATDTILEGIGKLQNQINGLIGGSIYEGTWNAATNTPTLTSGVGVDGHYYIVNVAGNTNLNGITNWNVGDWAIFHDGIWQKVDNTDAVVSVNGYTGAVSLVSSDIAEGATNLYFTNTRARQAISLTTTGSSGAATYNDGTGVLNIPNYVPDLSGYVPTTRTLTINGTPYDLSADRTWSVGTVTSVAALTIGTTGTDITSSVATSTTTPVITLNIPTASAANRGALSANDWIAFNSKQAALNGTGFVKISGTTISYDNSTYALDSEVVKLTGDQTIAGLKTFSGFALIENNLFLKQGSGTSFLPGYNVIDADSTGMIFGLSNTFTAHLNLASLTTQRSYILPNANGTIALTSDIPSVAGYVPYTGATQAVDLGNYNLTIKGISFGTGIKNNTNIAIGQNAMSYLNGGLNNIAIGSDALFVTSGDNSVAIGYGAGYYLNSGSNNVVIGSQAAYNAGPISNTVAIGKEALRYNQGTGNTAIGHTAGMGLSGSYNTILGIYDPNAVLNNNVIISDGQGNIRFQWDGSNIRLNGNIVGSNAYTSTAFTPQTRTLTINGVTFDLSANRSWTIAAGVTSFNTRTGAITLTSGDVTTALGYTPVTDARTLTINGVTYDLTANRSWTVAPSSSARTEQVFTATSGQTTFTVTGGYTVGLVDVYVNGVKLLPADFTATNGTTVVLADGVVLNDSVTIINYTATIAALPTSRDVFDYTATAGQTSFTVSGGYVVGLLDVYVNGVKLTSSEVTATNGTTFVLTIASIVGDQVQAIRYNASVNGVSGAGTTNFLPKFTASQTLGNSLIQDDGTTVTIGSTNSSLLMTRAANTNEALINFASGGTTRWNVGLRNTSTDDFSIFNPVLGIPYMTLSATTSLANFGVSVRALGYTSYASSGIFLVNSSGGTNAVQMRINNTGGDLRMGMESSAGGGFQTGTSAYAAVFGNQANNATQFTTNGTVRMTIDSSGDVGIGVIPSAWASGWVAMQVGTSALQNTGSFSQLSNNIFYDGTNYKFITSNGAGRIGLNTDGEVFIGTAGSGTAGGNATIVTRLSIAGATGVATFSDEIRAGSWIATANSRGFTIRNAANTAYRTAVQMNSSNVLIFGQDSDITALTLGVGSEAMRITSGGHVGIRVTPTSSWGSAMSALQIGTGGVISNWTGSNNNLGIGVNYYDNGAGSQLRLYTGGASKIDFGNDSISFQNAASNSAGTTLSFLERMRVSPTGAIIQNGVNGTLTKTGGTSITFTLSLGSIGAWTPGYATIRVSGTRGGLQEHYAAMYFLKLVYFQSSNVTTVNNVSGDTGSVSIGVTTAFTSGNTIMTITISDVGASTDYMIADFDGSFSTGIGSIT